MLDATIRIRDLVARAVDDGAPAIALTDHNNMFGAVEFYKAAKAAGIKPILGAEVNLTPRDRRDVEVRRTATLVLLCATNEGYRNLCYLLSRAYMDTPPRAPGPRIDLPLLKERAAGLIALSSGLSGEIPQALLRGQMDEALQLARTYQALFADGFYLELVRGGIKEQEIVNERLAFLSAELSIPLVAAADVHYARREDAAAHEILMCIQMGKSLPSLETKARVTDELYLAPAQEMLARFSDEPEAVASTLRIAEQCDVTLDLSHTYLPTYHVPQGFTSESYLRHVSEEGLVRRLLQAKELDYATDEAVYRERLDVELAIIDQMGFPGYFLIVWDFIAEARKMGVPVGPGRGSGAGSLVAYCLGITNIDPLRYGLLFERFLNPERVSMPDFDIDFCMNKRDQVIHYVTQKYGEDNVGQIITYGSMKAKAVVRDVARVLGLTFGEADRAAKLIPDDLGMTLDKAFKAEPRLADLCAEDPRYARLFEVGRVLEGLNRQPGMHAAGVVIGDKPLWEYVPLYAVHNDDGSITRITQYAKDEVEQAGLVKFDFLGLKTLTVIDHAVRLVNERRARDGAAPLDIDLIKLNDPKVFQLMGGGNTTGVFQLESSGFKELLRKLKPDCLEDVIAAVALYRPGPLQSGMVESFIKRKHGEERVVYPHPWLEDTLRETYGVMVYQEQVMQAARVLAGFSLGQADIMRRAMGKKKAKEMEQQRAIFAQGADANGVPAAQAGEIFDTIEKFAGYGFNKSHSAAYGLISYQTAWLKTHYPVEFMAALLTCDGDNTDKVVRFIAEARTIGITVLPPSVNASDSDFTTSEGAIRFGLGAVKGVGSGAIESIIDQRLGPGPFESLFAFCERVDLRRVNKRVMEALVKCGAFDDFALPRATLFELLDKAIERGQQIQRDRDAGQFDLFGALDAAQPSKPAMEAALIEVGEEWPDKLRLAHEKACLGFYVSGHPLDGYDGEIRRMRCTPLHEIGGVAHRDTVQVAAVVSAMRERPLKSGNGRMAFVTLEDRSGQAEMLVFSQVYGASEEALKADEPLLVEAVVQHEGDADAKTIRLKAEKVQTLREVRRTATRRVRLLIDGDHMTAPRLDRLHQILAVEASDGFPVEAVVAVAGQGQAIVTLGQDYRMGVSDEAITRLERVLGKGTVSFL
jgi:DNA polymerase-3 subunit alpha